MHIKATKFVHSCLVIETPERTAVFDPGAMSKGALPGLHAERVDDIIITHIHPDHFDIDLVKLLILRFPQARITTTSEVKEALGQAGITAVDQAPDGVKFFKSPHESVEPVSPQPQQNGIHYLDLITNPGDCHNFNETKPVLALPISGPWGSTIKALNLALHLKPKYVLPIHDWHMREESRLMFYDIFERILGEQGIKFFKLETGQTVEFEVNK